MTSTPKRRKSDAKPARVGTAVGSALPPDTVDDEWVNQCASFILQVEPAMTLEEAKAISIEMWHFERTGSMAPNEAVDFVASALGQDQHSPLERRRQVP